MAISAQRDLVSSMKTETFLNVSLIGKVQPLPSDLKQLFNKDALEKLTQNVFNPLSYYLVSIVDPGKAASFSWPLYDTKTERAYRNELSSFIAVYSGKGLLSPVMSSYLVNPACYKVTLFMFQLSQLAVQRILESKMKSEQKKLYSEMAEKYKTQNQGFVEAVETENKAMLLKLSNYLQKRKKYEKIAELFRNRIASMEDKMVKLKAQEYVANVVDSFKMDDIVDEETRTSIFEIKNFSKPAKFFDDWLEDIDTQIEGLETEWNAQMSPIVSTACKTMDLTKQLIDRHTGEADKNLFIIEYNPANEICTKDLQEKVNSQQKYILKNIVKNDRLSFLNLVRSYTVAVSYVLKNKQIGDDVYEFNKYLQQSDKSYEEMVVAMKVLMERLGNAEARLEPSSISFNKSISMKEITEIPPLPDLSDLSMKRDIFTMFDSFTPLGATRHQFNLRRTSTTSFLKPQNRSMYQAPRDDFLKNFISGQMTYDRHSSNPNVHNLSIISQVHARSNETIAECSSGFTKQQIQRLLSTNKKSSSTKKHKFKLDRPSITVKKGLFNVSNTSKALFNVSNTSSENGLFRCHSSPNLFESKENKYSKRRRKLSIMQEGSPSLLEVSGIMSLQNKHTPEQSHDSPYSNDFPGSTLPIIKITPAKAKLVDDLNEKIGNDSVESSIASIGPKESIVEAKETPKSKIPVPVKQTSSIERIINRFKRVKANVIAQEAKDEEIKTIVEEKENFNAVNIDVFTANRVLLPDLLSPSCSVLSMKASDVLDQICDDVDTEVRRPRESLGTALGVDNTFLDQFDLID